MAVTEEDVALNFECHCGFWGTREPIVLKERWLEPGFEIRNGVEVWRKDMAYRVKEVVRLFATEACKAEYLEKRATSQRRHERKVAG